MLTWCVMTSIPLLVLAPDAVMIVMLLVLPVVYIARNARLFRAPRVAVVSKASVLLVLDPLEAYRHTFDLSYVERIVELVKRAQEHGVPVVATRWVRTKGCVDDVFDRIGSWTEFLPTQSEPLLSEVSDVKWDLVLETVYSDALAPTYVDGVRTEDVLSTFMRDKGDRTTLVCAGTWAEACVRNTAYSAAVKGWTPVVVAPAVGGHMGARLHALMSMDSTFAHVVDEVTFE